MAASSKSCSRARWAALVVCAAVGVGRADPAPASHGEIGLGGDLLWTGADGDRQRVQLLAAYVPAMPGRFGGEVTWRDFNQNRAGLVMVGLVYVAAASRPVLVLSMHADVGVDLDQHAPAGGGGVRATLGLIDGVGLALDTGANLVVDGIDHSRLAFAGSALIVARW